MPALRSNDEPAEIATIAAARQQALAPLLVEIGELKEGFDCLSEPRVPLSSEQFAAALEDLGVLELINDAVLGPQRLAKLDLDDGQSVGRLLRLAAAEEVARIRTLLELIAELACFAPAEPAAELQERTVGAARRVAEAIEWLLEAIAAGTLGDVRAGEEHLQAALDALDFFSLEDFDRLHETSAPDLDVRIALVLRKRGRYTDETGCLHPGLVFGAFAGEASLFGKLGERATAYLGHLLPGTEVNEAEAAMLILPAVTLASLDRPFFAHRHAREMVELLTSALAEDRGEVRRVLERTTNEGPRIFASASRIHKGMRLIFEAGGAEAIDDELILREVMIAYQELTESAFRSHAWAVLELVAIATGASRAEGPPPTLGALNQRLEASSCRLAQALGRACDPELRNALAHAQYRWNRRAAQVEDLRTGRAWSLDEFDRSARALVNAVVGVDTGYCCVAISEGMAPELPQTPSAGHSPEITSLLGQAIFAANGYEVLGLADEGAAVTVASVGNGSDLTTLMNALASLSVLVPDGQAYRVDEGGAGRPLLNVSGEAMRTATGAPQVAQDLAIVAAFCDSEARVGGRPGEAACRGLALQAKIVAAAAMYDLAHSGVTTSVLARMRTRVEVVREFATTHRELGEPMRGTTVRRLERIVACSYAIERGERKALEKTVARINALFTWAEETGVTWPPSITPARSRPEPRPPFP